MIRPTLLRLDDRTTPTVLHTFAVGSAPGLAPSARLVDQATNQTLFSVQPFPTGFTGGVRTAVGDVTGDGVPDLVVGAGTGGGPHVRVYDGVTGQPVAGKLGSFYAFEPAFTGGVEVAVGDVNEDTYADVIVAASAGGGPRVTVFSGKDGSVLYDFYAFDSAFRGGVSVAAGDVNADGRADVVVGAGAGAGPHVKVFSGASGKELFSQYVYDQGFRGGVSVAAADTTADGGAEIITGAGPGAGPHVRILSADGTERASFYASAPTDHSGVRVSAGDVTGDNRAEVFTTAASGLGSTLTTFDAGTAAAVGTESLPLGGFVSCPATAGLDVVGAWNQAVLQAVREAKLNPPVTARVLAITHLAMFDAANGVTREFQPYLSGLGTPAAGASADAAASAAAQRVLAALLPAYADRWNNLLAADGTIEATARNSGEAFGRAVGDAYLAARANDGSAANVPYTPGTAPGVWTPTPTAFAAALLPGWGAVTPFALTSGSQFAPAAPPAISSAEYATAFNEVKSLGSATSTTRTADQTQIALFWADGGGTVTPPGHWNVILQGLVAGDGKSLTSHARGFALLNAALADAGITAWYAKFRDNFWRPVTAIRRAGEDANAATVADASWSPLIATPPFPSYTSGHSTFSSAAAEVLTALYGAIPFRTFSDALPDAGRAFASFTAAAAEAGQSRIYGGIHFQFDNAAGLSSGAQVGDWVVAKLMKPV